MSEDFMRYDQMVESALRSIVAEALTRVMKEGLSGEHHFYITFLTDQPGVAIPDRLSAQFPQQMTIVLQHQFSNLRVFPERFSVRLSFGGVPGDIVVPFAAITGFADPSVNFALQFQPPANSDGDGDEDGADPAHQGSLAGNDETQSASIDSKDSNAKIGNSRKKAAKDDLNPAAASEKGAGPKDAGPKDAGQDPAPSPEKGTVISLDRFRKK